jgi:hypothetical protein
MDNSSAKPTKKDIDAFSRRVETEVEDQKLFEYVRSLDDNAKYQFYDDNDEPIMPTERTGAFWKSYFLPKE